MTGFSFDPITFDSTYIVELFRALSVALGTALALATVSIILWHLISTVRMSQQLDKAKRYAEVQKIYAGARDYSGARGSPAGGSRRWVNSAPVRPPAPSVPAVSHAAPPPPDDVPFDDTPPPDLV